MLDRTILDDHDLLVRIAAQDRHAFAEFFGRYGVRIKAFMLRAGMADQDAEEIMQDVMVSVWRRAGTFDPAKAGVSTWVFAIARNRRIDVLRKHARPAPDPNDPMFQPDPEPDAGQRLSKLEMQTKVRRALLALPDEQRDVLLSAFFDGLSHGEVAQRLDLPLGTVKSRIRLACKALRPALGEQFFLELLDD
ncbi:MAG: sigma-70 family RNA polymerase sigma factor [Pseudomonadota bacterium]